MLDNLMADIGSNREILESAMSLSLTRVTFRTNQTMNRLAVVSTIFLPLTFICGVYGMNFDVMPEIRWQNGYLYFWLLVAVITGTMWLGLRRARLLKEAVDSRNLESRDSSVIRGPSGDFFPRS